MGSRGVITITNLLFDIVDVELIFKDSDGGSCAILQRLIPVQSGAQIIIAPDKGCAFVSLSASTDHGNKCVPQLVSLPANGGALITIRNKNIGFPGCKIVKT